MAEEHSSPSGADRSENEAVESEGHTPAAESAPASRAPHGPAESATKGMLREAIQKVKAEIAYHENEAKKHLQQAEELRKDLREFFEFLQQAGRTEEPVAAVRERPSPGNAQPGTAEKSREAPAAVRHPRAEGKKKRTARKSRER
jgi:hypothetical protein